MAKLYRCLGNRYLRSISARGGKGGASNSARQGFDGDCL